MVWAHLRSGLPKIVSRQLLLTQKPKVRRVQVLQEFQICMQRYIVCTSIVRLCTIGVNFGPDPLAGIGRRETEVLLDRPMA